MLQVYVLDVSSVLDICCIQVFHVACVLCCSESKETREVMVARHKRWIMVRHDELGPVHGAHVAPVSCEPGALRAAGQGTTGAERVQDGAKGGLAHAKRFVWSSM